jgi:hypothetical protein
MKLMLKSPRFILLLVTVGILGAVAWWRVHSEPKEPQLSISEGARIRIECAGISIAPDPGWGVETFEPGPADSSRPQLCSPGLKRLGASVTAVLLPKDNAPLQTQAEGFSGKLHLQEVNLSERMTSSGMKLIYATGFSARHADGGPAAPIRMDLFFVKRSDERVAVVYEVAIPEEAERFVSWFVKTARVEAQ